MRDRDRLPAQSAVERRLALELGIDSSLMLGIDSGGRMESFVLFENPRSIERFDRDDLPIFEVLADVLATSVARQRTEADRSLLFTAVEQGSSSIVITDAEGRILYVNPAFESTTGYSRREALGENPRVLKSGVHDDAFYARMWQVLQEGRTWQGEMVNKRKDGSLFHESATISPILDEQGRIVRFVAVKRDLSKERELETQLRQSQTLEAIGRLAAGVAHELNTPMQYVHDNLIFLQECIDALLKLLVDCSLAFEDPATAERPLEVLAGLKQGFEQADFDYLLEELPKALGQSHQGLERVVSIVRAMKDFSHPGSEGHHETDLNRAIESTLVVSRNEWKYVAEAELELDRNLPPVRCRSSEINQALLNLIINAAQAIAAAEGEGPGRITVRSVREDGWVRIEVEDTGTGIPPEAQPHIFEPFFTTKEVGKGTGQGLAITRNLVVEKHGGRIDFSTESGKGTVFRVWLPLHRDGQPAESGSSHD
jgi:two-component system, NtrC family, sensor kinase